MQKCFRFAVVVLKSHLIILTPLVTQREACLGKQQLQETGIHQTPFGLGRANRLLREVPGRAFMKPAEVILEQCLGMSYKGAVVPGQQSADEGFRNGGSHFCCAFRHPDERRAVVDAWESTTTDVLGQNANLRCWGHVSTQAAWQAALLPQVLVGSPIAMASHWLPGPSAVLMLGLANCKIRSLLKN